MNRITAVSKNSDNIQDQNVYRRLVKALGANFFGQIINLIYRLLLPPLFLKSWGPHIYGEWLILTSFVAYLSLTDMGGSTYINNRLTQLYAQKNIKLFKGILHTGILVFLILPLATFIFFVLAIMVLPIESLLNIKYTEHNKVILILAIFSLQFLFSLPLGILFGVYRAVGFLSRSIMSYNMIQFLQLIFTIIALIFKQDILTLAILQILPFLIVSFVVFLDLTKRFPEFNLISLDDRSIKIAKTFIRPSLQFFYIQISQLLTIQGTMMVVGTLLGSISVIIFSTLRTMSNVMKQLLSMVIQNAMPELTRLDASKNYIGLVDLFRILLRTTLVATTIFFIILHFYGETIFQFWIGKDIPYDQNLMDLFAIFMIQQVIWSAYSSLLMSINRHKTLSVVLVISSITTIILSFYFAHYFQLKGVLVGMIASELLLPFWIVPILVKKYNSAFSLPFFLKELIPIVLSLIIVVAFSKFMFLIICFIIIWWSYPLKNIGFKGIRLVKNGKRK